MQILKTGSWGFFWTAVQALLVFSFVAEASRSLFKNPDIKTRYSELLTLKNSQADSLLPAIDGDAELEDLLRRQPAVWSIERIEEAGELLTRIKIDLVYIDGIKEDQLCKLKSAPDNPNLWEVEIGLDFVSGAATVVEDHIQICLEYIRNRVGYTVKRGERVIKIPPKDILKEIDEHRISAEMDPEMQVQVLDVQKEVALSGVCPSDIRSYAILMDVWDQVKNTPMDIIQISNDLDPTRNGELNVHSCAFSRRWNEKYSETAIFSCDPDKQTCRLEQSEDGTTRWKLDAPNNRMIYEPPLRIFGWWPGAKSIHENGNIMDLRLIPISKNLYIEAWIDAKNFPVSLGLMTIGKKTP
jgi:hypothetical protein